MIRLNWPDRVLALWLAGLAGYIDAIGFMQIGGFFVSFMSGNSTRMAVALFENAADWMKAASLIASFFAGVIGGSLVGRKFAQRHFAVLAVVTACLSAAALCVHGGMPLISALLLAFAMGAENATFERDGEVQLGLTYMTGTLVKAGQRIAGALMGESPHAWVPHAILWLALVTGAIVGAAMHHHFGVIALWCGVLVSLGCCFAARGLDAQAGRSTASHA